jgi:hypothetical protein
LRGFHIRYRGAEHLFGVVAKVGRVRGRRRAGPDLTRKGFPLHKNGLYVCKNEVGQAHQTYSLCIQFSYAFPELILETRRD